MYELSVSRQIAAAPAPCWRVMSERLGEWWCPPPWRATVERLDRFPGGQSLLVMHGPNGETNRHPGFILAWDEGRRFAFTDAITADLEPAGPFMIGIWELAADGPDGQTTRFTARARHWTADARDTHRAMGFDTGWGIMADQFKALCEAE